MLSFSHPNHPEDQRPDLASEVQDVGRRETPGMVRTAQQNPSADWGAAVPDETNGKDSRHIVGDQSKYPPQKSKSQWEPQLHWPDVQTDQPRTCPAQRGAPQSPNE